MLPANPAQFDILKYRFSRSIEEVTKNPKRSSMLEALESHLLLNILPQSTPFTPIILFGRDFDPALAIERVASQNRIPFLPFLLTHEKAEREAMDTLLKHGFQRGHWLYFIVDYDCDIFLRQVGVALSTNANKGTGMIHHKLRVFIGTSNPSIIHWPSIITMHAKPVNTASLKR